MASIRWRSRDLPDRQGKLVLKGAADDLPDFDLRRAAHGSCFSATAASRHREHLLVRVHLSGPAGQRAPDADGRPVRPPGASVGAGARHPRPRLHPRRAQTPHRRGVPRHPRGRRRGVPDSGRAGGGAGVGGAPLGQRRDHQPGEEEGVRQPLLVSPHGSRLGAPDGQDVRAPTVRCAGHPQRPRVRRLPGAGGRDRVRQAGQLRHQQHRSHGPGPGRRHLVAVSGYRAPERGLRPVDLLGLSVFRPGPRRAAAQRFRLRLLGLPGRVQPEPGVSVRREGWSRSSTGWSTGPGHGSTWRLCGRCSARRTVPTPTGWPGHPHSQS